MKKMYWLTVLKAAETKTGAPASGDDLCAVLSIAFEKGIRKERKMG